MRAARFPSAFAELEPGPRGCGKENVSGGARGVDYRDEEEVDGVVTAGGSCKIKRRLLLC